MESHKSNARVPLNQWQVLGGMRFLLSLVVLAAHVGWVGYSPLMELAIFNGKAAVIGFFFISGYAIAASLNKNTEGFYRRRFLRIYPLYFFAVVFSQFLAVTMGPVIVLPNFTFTAAGWPTTVCNLLALQRFACISHPYNLPLWSLGAECFYYWLAPLFARLRTRYLLALTFGSAIFFFLSTTWSEQLLFGFTPIRLLWFWLLGFLLFRHRDSWAMRLAIVASSFGVMQLGSENVGNAFAYVPPIVTAVALFYTPHLHLPKLIGRGMEYLGDLSYPLYLLHSPAFIFGYAVLGWRDTTALLGVVFAISILALYLIDGWLSRKVLRPLLIT